jgi:hypothetical protein
MESAKHHRRAWSALQRHVDPLVEHRQPLLAAGVTGERQTSGNTVTLDERRLEDGIDGVAPGGMAVSSARNHHALIERSGWTPRSGNTRAVLLPHLSTSPVT